MATLDPPAPEAPVAPSTGVVRFTAEAPINLRWRGPSGRAYALSIVERVKGGKIVSPIPAGTPFEVDAVDLDPFLERFDGLIPGLSVLP